MSKPDWTVTVLCAGVAPKHAWHAAFSVGVQSFNIMPVYFEDEDEKALESAEFMADTLRRALERLTA